jgi:hypothetical protein
MSRAPTVTPQWQQLGAESREQGYRSKDQRNLRIAELPRWPCSRIADIRMNERELSAAVIQPTHREKVVLFFLERERERESERERERGEREREREREVLLTIKK